MVQENLNRDIKLPPLPSTVRECLAQMYSVEADMGKLSSLVQKDPGISSSVLKLANSAIFAAGKPTSDLKIGMTRIGLTSLMQILVKYSMEAIFKFDDFDFFSIKSFTKHCSWVSQIVFELGKITKSTQLNDLLVAGLLHDVGLLVRAINDPIQMKLVVEKCINEKIDFHTAEKSLKVESHEVLGELILKKWQLPEEVTLLVKYHHASDVFRPKNLSSEQNKSINLFILSDTVAHRFGNAFVNYARDTRVNSIDLDKLGISNQDVGVAVKTATQQLQSY